MTFHFKVGKGISNMKVDTIKRLRTLKMIFIDNISFSNDSLEAEQWKNVLNLLNTIEEIEGITI
jgi:hypothetical protein